MACWSTRTRPDPSRHAFMRTGHPHHTPPQPARPQPHILAPSCLLRSRHIYLVNLSFSVNGSAASGTVWARMRRWWGPSRTAWTPTTVTASGPMLWSLREGRLSWLSIKQHWFPGCFISPNCRELHQLNGCVCTSPGDLVTERVVLSAASGRWPGTAGQAAGGGAQRVSRQNMHSS